MTDNWLERTELLLGAEKLEKLRAAHVLVVGLGGVGAYAAEMIVRAGVGRMTVADADTVNPTSWWPSTRPSAGPKPRCWPSGCGTSTRHSNST